MVVSALFMKSFMNKMNYSYSYYQKKMFISQQVNLIQKFISTSNEKNS